MDFNLSEEQKLIRNAVDKFIRNDYSFDARKKSWSWRTASAVRIGSSSPTWAGWASRLSRNTAD